MMIAAAPGGHSSCRYHAALPNKLSEHLQFMGVVELALAFDVKQVYSSFFSLSSVESVQRWKRGIVSEFKVGYSIV